jgi:hypothetical protein
MSAQEPSLEFVCPRCGDTISETVEEVPSYDVSADRESDAEGYVEQTVACSGCEHQFTVGIRNTGACLVAELADHKAHVSVIGDPIHEPDDPWEAEAYQRENLPEDPAKIRPRQCCAGFGTKNAGKGRGLWALSWRPANRARLTRRIR